MEIGTSEYLDLSPRRALGCREKFPKSSAVITQIYRLRNVFFSVRCAVAADFLLFT